MARKKKSELEAEKAASTKKEEASAPPEEEVTTTIIDETAGAELVDPAPKKKPRPKPKKKDDPPRPSKEELKAAEPKRYLVIRGGRIMHRGALTLMRTGKTFKANDYNVPQLLQQGIELKEV